MRNYCGGPLPCSAIVKVAAVIITEPALDISGALVGTQMCTQVSGYSCEGVKVADRSRVCVCVCVPPLPNGKQVTGHCGPQFYHLLDVEIGLHHF